jgi:hypothetical protein
VEAVVTALTPGEGRLPDGHAVRLSLNTPVISAEWLEFGISLNKNTSTKRSQPKVVLICASIDGLPVEAEVVMKIAGNGAAFDVLNGYFGERYMPGNWLGPVW